MKMDGGALEFFQSLPDDLLVEITLHDREALERLCIALSIDIQLIIEDTERLKRKKIKNKN
jgi:hypothetical protein